MHTASEVCCIHDASKSFYISYPLQYDHSEYYHQSQLKRTRRCKKLNESSIIMHTASELRCIHDDSKSLKDSYLLQHNYHSECYQRSQLKRSRRCKKLNESLWTRQFKSTELAYMRAAKAKSSLYRFAFSQEENILCV